MNNILEISHLTKTFGGLNAVSDVNLHIGKGELIGLIGPNGAGKTTVFNLITGVYKPNEGSILLDGKIVYIGKSRNILMRMAQHYAQLSQGKEHKYRLLAEATRNGHKMCFTVLYRAKQTDYDAITEEIGNMEGRYIRLHRPPLNQ